MKTSPEEHGFPEAAAQANRERRLRLARLPIEEKIRILVRMQHVAAEIARSSGRPVRKPWVLED